MKTIDEMLDKASDEAAMEEVYDTLETSFKRVDPIRKGYFKEGAEWMRKVLTQWHDIRTEFPEFRQELLFKLRRKNGTTFYVLIAGERIFAKHVRGAEVLAWRYIHE